MGFSMLGWHEGPDVVFDAVVRSCFTDDNELCGVSDCPCDATANDVVNGAGAGAGAGTGCGVGSAKHTPPGRLQNKFPKMRVKKSRDHIRFSTSDDEDEGEGEDDGEGHKKKRQKL